MTPQEYPIGNIQPWYVGLVPIPGSITPVFSGTTKVNKLYLANTSDAEQTVTIYDNSTNNNGGPCQIWPAVPIAAHSVDVVNLGAIVANGGVSWVASAADAVHAEIVGGRGDA